MGFIRIGISNANYDSFLRRKTGKGSFAKVKWQRSTILKMYKRPNVRKADALMTPSTQSRYCSLVVGYYKALALAMLVKKIWIIYLLSPYLPRSDFDTIS